MGLFSKKCAVCGGKLPEKRQYKDVCTPCGSDYDRLKAQISDTLAVIEKGKNPVTCYDRCMFGMGLVHDFSRFVETGYCTYPTGRSLEEFEKLFSGKAAEFAGIVREKNEARGFDKKVGLPHFGLWRKLYSLSGGVAEGVCKGCFSKPAENAAGFCRVCLVVGTGANQDDMDAFRAVGGGEGLEGEDLTIALLHWKLARSKEG